MNNTYSRFNIYIEIFKSYIMGSGRRADVHAERVGRVIINNTQQYKKIDKVLFVRAYPMATSGGSVALFI